MSYSKIINKLYLGNQYSTTIIKNIDTIISIGCISKNKNNINNYKISIRDKTTTNLTPYLDEISDYIEKELKKKHNILIHCKAGINRSPAFVLAYLCKYQNMNIEEAKKLILQKRTCVKFQEHYVKQIELWLNTFQNK